MADLRVVAFNTLLEVLKKKDKSRIGLAKKDSKMDSYIDIDWTDEVIAKMYLVIHSCNEGELKLVNHQFHFYFKDDYDKSEYLIKVI